MPSATEITNHRLFTYRPVPPAGVGVCAICHSGPTPGFDICLSCRQTTRQVSRATHRVVPISLYKPFSQLSHVLRSYKDARPEARAVLAIQVAAMTARFLENHHRCLTTFSGGELTLATEVPSSQPCRRPGEHPLAGVIKRVSGLASIYQPVLVRDSAPLEHRQASDSAFAATRPLGGQRLLLCDDTFTTGARVQSAASALLRAGATSVTALVVGRVVYPDWNENCRKIWEWAYDTDFSFERCCLCSSRDRTL